LKTKTQDQPELEGKLTLSPNYQIEESSDTSEVLKETIDEFAQIVREHEKRILQLRERVFILETALGLPQEDRMEPQDPLGEGN
jgi:hypothetical protein